jgi:queuine/archaeosine tRNA-ribosyltransferase
VFVFIEMVHTRFIAGVHRYNTSKRTTRCDRFNGVRNAVVTIKRPISIPFAGVGARLPAFFPSVSSIKTNFSPLDYIEVLMASGTQQFLISAYDISEPSEDDQMAIAIRSALDGGRIVLLDSGNYESYWRRDSNWTQTRFWQVLKAHDWDVAFSFDKFCMGQEASQNCAKQIADSYIEDQLQRPGCALLPIVHGSTEDLPVLCREVASLVNPMLIAVPERELGEGILARLDTLQRIRQELNHLGAYYPLHLLGTGNPWSILLYTAAGADTFDGLEWCQTVVDPQTAILLHFQQRELIQRQLIPPGTHSYDESTMLHNLLFYRQWMQELQTATASKSLRGYIRTRLAAPVASRVETVLHEH